MHYNYCSLFAILQVEEEQEYSETSSIDRIEASPVILDWVVSISVCIIYSYTHEGGAHEDIPSPL